MKWIRISGRSPAKAHCERWLSGWCECCYSHLFKPHPSVRAMLPGPQGCHFTCESRIIFHFEKRKQRQRQLNDAFDVTKWSGNSDSWNSSCWECYGLESTKSVFKKKSLSVAPGLEAYLSIPGAQGKKVYFSRFRCMNAPSWGVTRQMVHCGEEMHWTTAKGSQDKVPTVIWGEVGS